MQNLDLSSLLSGVAGALLVFVLTVGYSRLETWLGRRRERKGLLFLIDAEVRSHILSFENLKEELQERTEEEVRELTKMGLHALATPRTEDWDRSKERLAQLLKPLHMKDLTIYYKALKDIIEITASGPTEEYRTIVLAALSGPLVAQGNAIRQRGKKYLRKLPDYDEPGLDAPKSRNDA